MRRRDQLPEDSAGHYTLCNPCLVYTLPITLKFCASKKVVCKVNQLKSAMCIHSPSGAGARPPGKEVAELVVPTVQCFSQG